MTVNEVGELLGYKIKLREEAFRSRLATYQIEAKDGLVQNTEAFFRDIGNVVVRLIAESLQKHKQIKVNLKLECTYKNLETREEVIKGFNS